MAFLEQISTEYQIVIISKADISTISDLKGKKYCHPGFDTTDVSPYSLKQLEMAIIKENTTYTCNSNTIVENEVKYLAEYFGPSCRPGSWVQNSTFDKELSRRTNNNLW